MKKLMALLMAAILMLSCAGALAENVRFVEDSPYFDIEMPLPEGAVLGQRVGSGELNMVEIIKEGLATVRITIAYSELYDENTSMNDLPDDEINAMKELAGMEYENPELTVDVTPSGNKYIHVCANAESDLDAIFTLYKGYFLQLTQWHDDYSEITDADYEFMQQLLYAIEFLPLEK